MHFDRDVSVHRADLAVRGVNVASYSVTGFNYDLITHTATWTLGRAVANDRLVLNLAGDGASRQPFSSGLTILTGDVDRNGVVNSADLADVRRRLGRTASSTGSGAGAYSALADVNGDGRINSFDQTLVLRNMGRSIPAAPPAAAAVPVAAQACRPSIDQERVARLTAVRSAADRGSSRVNGSSLVKAMGLHRRRCRGREPRRFLFGPKSLPRSRHRIAGGGVAGESKFNRTIGTLVEPDRGQAAAGRGQ